MYNPALEKLRNQAEQRLHQRRMQQLAQWQEQTSMRSLFDPLLNKKARARIEKAGDNWFETTARGYAELFDSNYIEWFRNPGNALINNLTTIGDTLDYAANLIKAPLLAAVKGEDVGTRLEDAYGLGDNGRVAQNMSELREVIGAPTSGVLGGTAAGALIGTSIVPGLGTLIGAGAGLVVGLASGITGHYGIELGNTVTDIALEYVVDPANILGAVGAVGDVKYIAKVSGASDDIAKMVTDAGGRVKPLAESINHQSINKVSDFAASTTKNIDAESTIDYGMIKIAQSSAKYTDDVVKQQKIFNRTKTAFFKSAYDNDYDSFVKVMTETGARNVNGFFLDDNHLKVMHATMVRDANLSRGYRVAKLFERIDSKFAKTLWKGTGPGIVYNAGLKNILKLKTLSANKVLDSINPEAETYEILSDAEYDNIFKELDDLGIRYPKQGETLSKLDMEDLYDDMQNSIAKLELDGNERLSNVLKGMASKMEFEVHGRLVSAKSVRSNMNLIIRSFYNHKGDMSKVLTDLSVQKAVNGIIDILYLRQGENIFFNAAASLGTNKKLIKLISNNEGMSKIVKLAGDNMDMGGSTVVARVMSEVAMKYLDDDPINQYKNVIKSVADKTLKQKGGVIGAEQLMRIELTKAQEAISRKLDVAKDISSVEKMKYNKAILDLDRAKFDLVNKDFFLPEDLHLLNSAKEAVSRHKELQAAYDMQLDNFLRVTDITMRAIEEKPTVTAATKLNIISGMNISKESEFAAAARSAIAAEKIAQAKIAGDIGVPAKAKAENELIESATALAAEYISKEAMFTPDMIEFVTDEIFARTSARIYSVAKTMITESEAERYYKDLHTSIQKQLNFIAEYKGDYSNIVDYLDALTKEVESLDEVISKTYPKNANDAYREAFAIIMGGSTNNVLKGEPLNLAKSIAGNVNGTRIPDMYFKLQDMLPNLSAAGRGSVRSRVNSLHTLFTRSLDDSVPLHFNTVLGKSKSVLNFETKKITKKDLSNLELLFKDLFDDPDIALELSADFKQMFNIYNRLGKIAMHDTNFIETGTPSKLFLDVKQELETTVNEFTRNKWNPYLAYFYSKRAFLDTHGDMNINHFKEGSKEFLKALNDINNTVAVDEEGKLIMAKVYQGYTVSFKKSIFDIIDKHIKGDIDYKHIRAFVSNTSQDRRLLTQYINDMVTAVKYIRVMASIEGAFSSIGKTSMSNNVPNMLRNIESIIDMFMKDTVNDIILQSDGSLDKMLKLYTDLVQGLDTWFDEINDKLIEPALTKDFKLRDVELIDIVDSTDVVYKGSNKSYTELFNHTFTKTDNNYNALMSDIKSGFMQVDQKVCKLVDADGVSDIPDDVLIHADMSKILSADLETMLIKRGIDPTPEDVVQFGLSDKVSKKGILVYNPKYKRDGNEQLLPEDFINGKRAEGFNPREFAAFKVGKVNSVSWVDPDDNKTYVLYKDSASAYNDVYTLIKDYIQEINGKKYILTVGQNSTNFDNPVILKALNKYAGANIEGILSVDVMEFTRMLQGMSKAREVCDPSQIGEYTKIDKDFDNLMSAMSEIPDSRLEDVFDSLVKHRLIDDVDGLAHNADVDVVMTEAIFNTYKKVLKAESVRSLKDFKDIVSGYANGVNDSLLIQLQEAFDGVKKIISPKVDSDEDYIKLLETHLSFDSDYDNRRFERAMEYFNSDVEDMLSPGELRNLWTFVEDFNRFVPADNVAELDDLIESVDNLRIVLNKIRLVRSNVMKGMWGDSTVTFQSNKHFNTALMCSNYKSIRNSQDFLDLYTLYKGGEVGHVASGSLVEMILKYRNQLGGVANLSYLTEDLDRVYDYVEVMDEFTSFHDDIWEIFSWSIEGLEKGTAEYDKRAQAFSRILDKMFGTGKSEKLRSINGKFEDILKENPLIDQDELYDLVYEAVDPNQFFKDVIEDFSIVDPEGLMYDRVINYVIYCIGSLNKRDIRSRYKTTQPLNLLNPTMDRHFIDTYRRVYNDIIGHFKDAYKAKPDKPLVGELQQEFDVINSAEDYLNELVSSMRAPLSEITSLHHEYSSYGEIPEGWLNYQLGKNSWEINGSLSNITFKHKNRPEDYYMCKKVENKFQELAGIEFDPREKMDVIPYRNEMSESLKSINALLNDENGIGINELYDLINEFNFKGMDYKIKKINMYAQMYDEIMEALPEDNVYKKFAEIQFNRVWSYTDEAKTQDMELRQLYTNYFKAIAVNAYVAKRDQQSVYDTLKALKKPSEDFIRRPLQEAREQMLGLFKRQDGSIDYESLFNYVNNPNNSLQFVVAFKSNKYQRYNITTNSMDDLAEIQIVNIKNPAQLQRLIENSTGQYNFSILDKHTVLQYRQRIGHQQSNRVYRSSILNKLVEMRKWISSYIMAPLKTMSLYNIGFTITNALEGAYKTAMETTGNRASLIKHYGNAQRIHRNWYELNSKIAVATQGSRYFTSRDQLKLLENENILSGIFANHADEFIAGNYTGILADLEKSNLPKYMIKDTKNMLRTALDESKVLEYISNQISRYNKTSALINELGNYNLDEFKIMANFINSPAAAAEFQNIKKSAELNLIGDSKEDNIYQKTIKKALYSKWFPDRNPLNEITPYANLSRNSDIELINRFAMYLDLVEKGHFENEALNKVLATHFNYGDKSQLESAAELFFPFISFPIRNYMFWMEAMERHPILLKSFIDMALCNWGDEKNNPYNQTKITKGGLRLWNDVSIESGLSVFDAMAFGGNTLNVLTQRKLNPLVGVAIEGAKQLTVGESNLQYRLGRLPIISHVQAGANLVDNLIKGQPKIYDIAPSLFNEVYKNNRYYYANQGRYAYKSAYNRLYYASGGRRTGINRTRNMVR